MAAVFGLVNPVTDLLNAGTLDRTGADLVDGFLDEIDQVLGVFYQLPEDAVEETLPEAMQAMIAERETARKEKNWARADEIRDSFLEQGYVLKDTSEGTEWRRE